jgi:hypothetical protein
VTCLTVGFCLNVPRVTVKGQTIFSLSFTPKYLHFFLFFAFTYLLRDKSWRTAIGDDDFEDGSLFATTTERPAVEGTYLDIHNRINNLNSDGTFFPLLLSPSSACLTVLADDKRLKATTNEEGRYCFEFYLTTN